MMHHMHKHGWLVVSVFLFWAKHQGNPIATLSVLCKGYFRLRQTLGLCPVRVLSTLACTLGHAFLEEGKRAAHIVVVGSDPHGQISFGVS